MVAGLSLGIFLPPRLGGDYDALMDSSPSLRTLLEEIYGDQDLDLEALVRTIEDRTQEARKRRSQELLRWEDELPSDWMTRPEHVVYVAYVDRFGVAFDGASSLAQCRQGLAYLKILGVRHLHLLPLMKSSGDCGFAVDDYAEVDPRFGSHEDLLELAREAHRYGMTLTLDFVLNHVSDSHPFARALKAREPGAEKFFHLDASGSGEPWPLVPDIFPDFAPGHWDWVPEAEVYVWSTFYSRQPKKDGPKLNDFAQWDLNYSEPEVLVAMLESMFQILELGVDCLRLDAIPFLWKNPGTRCTSQPRLHPILQVFRRQMLEVAPKSALLAEANDVTAHLEGYFGLPERPGHECQMAYSFPLLAGLWGAVGLGRLDPLHKVLGRMKALPKGCSWLVFDEVHDEVSLEIVEDQFPGAEGRELTRDLFQTFTQGRRGLPFRFDPEKEEYGHGFSGTRWSLLGGDEARGPEEVELVFARIHFLDGLKFSLPGTPLIYCGQEVALSNRWSFLDDPLEAPDTRFLKRTFLPREAVEGGEPEEGPLPRADRMLQSVREWALTRAQLPALGGTEFELLEGLPETAIGYWRGSEATGRLLVLAAVEDCEVDLPQGVGSWLEAREGSQISAPRVELKAWQVLWLQPSGSGRTS